MKQMIQHYVVAFIGISVFVGMPLKAQQPAQFDQPGYYLAQVLAPGVPLSSDRYQVRSKGYDDGLNGTFEIDSHTGEKYTAVGRMQLYQRIAEIYAIDQLRTMDSGDQFGDSLGKTAGNTVTAVGKTVSDPIGFLGSIPKGASKFFGSVGESLKGGKSEYEGQAYSNVLGQSKSKRLLAFKLGVNPYSTNETLQKELNRVGWSEAGGSVLVNVAVAAIPAGAGTALNMNRNVQGAIVSQDPNQLGIMNRKKFEEIGIGADTANLLLKHKAYSPTHRTVITEALTSLGEGRGQDVFLKVAQRAQNEIDANYFQQAAQLIELYNQKEGRVQHILRSGNTVSFKDAHGNWVFPLPFDYALWTEDIHARAQRAFTARKPGERVILYTTGQLSPAAQAAVTQDQVEIVLTSLDGD